MAGMLPLRLELDFPLTPEERDGLITQCEGITSGFFGTPNMKSANDARERRLVDGTYAKLARTVIRPSAEHVGFVMKFDLFTPETEAIQDEECIKFEGEYFSLTVDMISRSTHRTLGHGALEIDEVGDHDICLFSTFDIGECEEEVLRSHFSHNVLTAYDQFRLFDIRMLLQNV